VRTNEFRGHTEQIPNPHVKKKEPSGATGLDKAEMHTMQLTSVTIVALVFGA
jgi:hypothetical protein